jgi:hypothetical protein
MKYFGKNVLRQPFPVTVGPKRTLDWILGRSVGFHQIGIGEYRSGQITLGVKHSWKLMCLSLTNLALI